MQDRASHDPRSNVSGDGAGNKKHSFDHHHAVIDKSMFMLFPSGSLRCLCVFQAWAFAQLVESSVARTF
jgi:hypothetical protein